MFVDLDAANGRSEVWSVAEVSKAAHRFDEKFSITG
jgi:hypothetical protein